MRILTSLALMLLAAPVAAQEPALAKPVDVLKSVVSGMPRSERQQVAVMTAEIAPGQKTPFHTHRFPVTIYVSEGAFTLEMEGRAPVVVTAGQSFVEPPGVKMTGYNRSAVQPMRVVIFYVSEPDTPFLDPVK